MADLSDKGKIKILQYFEAVNLQCPQIEVFSFSLNNSGKLGFFAFLL